MKISKRTQVYVRGIGFVKAEELVKLIQGGNVIELRGMFGNWVKVNEGYLNVKSDSIKLELRNGLFVVTSSDTDILHILPNSYSIASKRIDELKKSNILVYGNQLVDEDNAESIDDSELMDVANILNCCSTYVDHGYEVFTFSTRDLKLLELIYKRFVPTKKQNKYLISKKLAPASKSNNYSFRLPYTEGSRVMEIIEKYDISLSNKVIPNKILTADRDSRIRFYKHLNPMNFCTIKMSDTVRVKVGTYTRKSYSNISTLLSFMNTIGISGIIRSTRYDTTDNKEMIKHIYQLNSEDCMHAMYIDKPFLYEGARSFVYTNPSWSVSNKSDYPASCRSIFNACCADNGSETYKFLKKFYEYQQPIKIKTISETEEDMVELIADDYVDVNGVFLK